ncbi:MAG: methyltransferase [Alphaproteobacteria bacterium]
MRIILAAACLALAACGTMAGGVPAAPLTATSANIVAAISDTRRPDADKARDADRHPAETLAFAEIRPGDKVGELSPGGGYFTRLFAVAVGESGHVYPLIRPEGQASQFEHPVGEGYANVSMVRASYSAMTFPEPLDVIFTAQNYHDFHIARFNFGDMAAIDAAVFRSLKPGGLFVIIDHSAVNGTGTTNTEALHRIDEATVRSEMAAAGFVFDGETQVLRNPADPRTANVFDASIRGHTDQFALRFRKPR